MYLHKAISNYVEHSFILVPMYNIFYSYGTSILVRELICYLCLGRKAINSYRIVIEYIPTFRNGPIGQEPSGYG